jgi:glycosyltransferase involved in cell wall biosynthesis
VTFHGGGHSSRVRNAIRGSQRRILAPLFKRAARLIALAEFELDLFGDELGIPRERFTLIPNGCDLPQHSAPGSDLASGPLIASVGRLERYKGHQRILAAMPHIRAEYPAARLWIAGSGPHEAALRTQAAQLGLTDCVEIRAVPPHDRQAMANELSRAALVVLLSEYETHPIAIFEALALGRPALVADTSGLSEIARRGLARSVALNSSPETVARAVGEQLREPLLPGDVSLPTWDDCVTALHAMYEGVAIATRA